jgi:arylsulfatase A-like enzyme
MRRMSAAAELRLNTTRAIRSCVAGTLLLAALSGLLLSGGCRHEKQAFEKRPLFAENLAPEILSEQCNISLPPSWDANRFLAGWGPLRKTADRRLVVAPNPDKSRLSVVHLVERRRTLTLDLDPAGPFDPWTVSARIAGRDLGRFPVGRSIEVPIPADLPTGRLVVDIAFQGGSEARLPFGVTGAHIRPALPAGAVRNDRGALRQSGSSIVQVVQKVGDHCVLAGSFVPPDSPKKDQSFELLARGDDGKTLGSFSWSARESRWSGTLRRRRFELPLGDRGGFIRFQLVARGSGPEAAWEDLALLERKQPEVASAGRIEPPPPRVIVFYVMDALRADEVGCMGGPAGITPTIDRLASEGTAFLSHYTVAPNTLPSTRALFAGRMPVVDGWAKLPSDGPPTMAEVLKRAGYTTGLFSANGNVSGDFGMTRGFDHDGTPQILAQAAEPGQPAYNNSAELVNATALEWLRSLGKSQKAFLYLHIVNPHTPYDPPEPYRSRFAAGIPSAIDGSTETVRAIKHGRVTVSEPDKERLRGLYAGNLAYADAELGKFLVELTHRVRPEELFFVLTADHGEELFDHEGVLHGFTLYEEMVHIPLVLWAPGRIPSLKFTGATDSLDLRAALLDLAGADPAELGDGTSFLPALRGAPWEKQVLFASASSLRGGIFSARSDRFKLVLAPRIGAGWGMGSGAAHAREPEFLFDLAEDPHETVNRAGDDDLEVAWLRSLLLARVGTGMATAGTPEKPVLSEETKRNLRALGYIQ